MISYFGKLLIFLGIILILIGFIFLFVNKIPFLGKLPGDFYIKKENFVFYFPLSSSILVSVVLSIFFYFLIKVLK